MTKQEKLEREKKAEERSKIFDDWTDDDEEEILPPEPLKSKSSSSETSNGKTSENDELKEKPKSSKTTQQNLKNDSGDDKLLDIDKMLEETAVPTISLDAASKNSPKKPKRGVKFSEELSKDIAIKKIQLVQTASNLADPMDVDDEFAFSEEPELAVAKPILKRPNRPPPKIIHEPVKPDAGNDEITGSVESVNEPSVAEKVESNESKPSNISNVDVKSGELNKSTISDEPSETMKEQVNKSNPETTILRSETNHHQLPCPRRM